MDISIIIVNYNTKDETSTCIESIFEKTTGIDFEVILVDNDSCDGSKELFSSNNRITFIETGNNLGFGKANNVGLQVAQGKYVFFLNSDTYLYNNAIKQFFDYCESHQDKRIGAIGCLLKSPDLQRTHSFADFPKISRILLSRMASPLYKFCGKTYHTLDNESLIKEEPFEVDYVTGADLFIRKSLLDEYGAFDPDFFMYFEETELQYRLHKAGYSNYILPTPSIVHLEGGSLKKYGQRNVKKMMMTQKSQFLYFKKTSSRLSYLAFRMAFVFIRLPFLLFSSLTLKEKKAYWHLITSKV